MPPQDRKLFTDSKKFLSNRFADKNLADSIVNRVNKQRRNRIPEPLADLRVTVEPASINGRTYARTSIDFIQNNDPNFAGARVWVKGYGTDNVLGDEDPDATTNREESLAYELKALITRSPSTVLFEASSEEIVIGVEAVNLEGVGSGLDSMPTIQITLI